MPNTKMISWTIRGRTQPHLAREIRLRSKFMVHKGNIFFTTVPGEKTTH